MYGLYCSAYCHVWVVLERVMGACGIANLNGDALIDSSLEHMFNVLSTAQRSVANEAWCSKKKNHLAKMQSSGLVREQHST